MKIGFCIFFIWYNAYLFYTCTDCRYTSKISVFYIAVGYFCDFVLYISFFMLKKEEKRFWDFIEHTSTCTHILHTHITATKWWKHYSKTAFL